MKNFAKYKAITQEELAESWVTLVDCKRCPINCGKRKPHCKEEVLRKLAEETL